MVVITSRTLLLSSRAVGSPGQLMEPPNLMEESGLPDSHRSQWENGLLQGGLPYSPDEPEESGEGIGGHCSQWVSQRLAQAELDRGRQPDRSRS